MNIEYLDTLPEVINKYKVELQDGEKVIFTAKPSCFGTETGRMLGMNPKITLTNKRIIADNNVGVWTVDIEDDIVECTKVTKGSFIFKSTYISVTLNTEIVFNDGKEKMTGFQFYFNKKDINKFEEIMNNLLK